jgi:hypothetical protein
VASLSSANTSASASSNIWHVLAKCVH